MSRRSVSWAWAPCFTQTHAGGPLPLIRPHETLEKHARRTKSGVSWRPASDARVSAGEVLSIGLHLHSSRARCGFPVNLDVPFFCSNDRK